MAPTQRVVLAIVGFLGGLLAAGLAASVVVAANGWELSVPATIGSELGRTVRQVGQAAPLDDFRVPAAWLAVINAPLWAGLIGAPLIARRGGLDWVRDLGWSMRPVDVPLGLAVGVATQFALTHLYELVFLVFGDQDVAAPARSLVASVDTPIDLLGLLVVTVVMAPLSEEIVYRGLLFGGIRDMERGHVGSGVVIAAVVSSVIFAASHFQVIQFPGLLVFGLVAVALFHRTGRLGTAIWAHVGFNLTTVVLLLTF
ncbi:MAG: CPBP family intramembrane glutamic endopeptidase [Actinomycetota bacterium]